MRDQAHRAKRSLGQNFLVDANICRKIVAALEPSAEDAILEIGPGQGALTRHLLAAPHRLVMAVEKDRDLAAALKAEWPELAVVLGDALQWQWEHTASMMNLRIVGNLPYNIASPLIWEIVSRCSRYMTAVVMVQHEVAQRLTARSGGKDYGALSAWVQSFSTAEYLFKVPPTVFRPRPKVDSAVVRLCPLPAEHRPDDPRGLATILRICFQKRRKQLGTILRPHLGPHAAEMLAAQGLSSQSRPEMLNPGDFQRLATLIAGNDFLPRADQDR